MRKVREQKLSIKSNREKTLNMLFYIGLIAIPVIQVCIFYFYVNINSILLSMREYSSDGSSSFAGFKNFAKVLNEMFADTVTSKEWGMAFRNSGILILARMFISLPLSLVCSYYVAKKSLGYKFFRVVLFLPGIISGVVLAMIYRYLVDDAILLSLGQSGVFNKHEMTTFLVILAYCIFVELGQRVLLLSSSMGEIDQGVIEAARLDGVNSFQEFVLIYIPMIWPMLITYVVSTLAISLTDQMSLFTFYKGNVGSTMRTVGFTLYFKTYYNSTTVAQYPYLAAMGIILTVITVAVTFSVRKLMTKFGPREE